MTAPTIQAEYVPGPWVGMAGAEVWLLADLDPADPVIAQCWELVRQGSVVDALLNAMAGSRLRPALNIAIVRIDRHRAEIIVRGDAWAQLCPADGEVVELRATPGSWESRTAERFAVVRLNGPGADAQSRPCLPLGTGVVTAGQIVVRAEPSDAATAVATTAESDPGGSRPATVDGPAAAGQFDAMFGPTTRPEPEPEYAAAVPVDWSGLGVAAAPPVGSPPGNAPAGLGFSTPGTAVPSATLPPEHTSVPIDDGTYRSPFEGPFAGSLRPGPVAPPPPPSSSPATGRPGGVIEDVSWAIVPEEGPAPDPYGHPAVHQPPAPAYPAPPPGPAAAYGGIDPELLQTTRRGAQPSAPTGPIVSGVWCPVGHANPPDATTCRVCAQPVPSQPPQPMTRPPLGVLRLSTGEVVPLDKGVVLGRAPGAPQGLGADEPHRIQLPSPDGSISRRHVEVVLDGWWVTVVDLKSTNGTVVTPAGGVSETLPPGGRKVMEHGCLVNLDATTWFRFEVTP